MRGSAKIIGSRHILEVYFSFWLSNIVLVPKPLEKWTVCVNFRDQKKAIQKEYYLLSCIDQLVDSMIVHQQILMMEAYKGYSLLVPGNYRWGGCKLIYDRRG